jgi:hypothetical protein
MYSFYVARPLLKEAMFRGLCPMDVASFYQNLEKIYIEYNYDSHQIWNVDESGAQLGNNGSVGC